MKKLLLSIPLAVLAVFMVSCSGDESYDDEAIGNIEAMGQFTCSPDGSSIIPLARIPEKTFLKYVEGNVWRTYTTKIFEIGSDGSVADEYYSKGRNGGLIWYLELKGSQVTSHQMHSPLWMTYVYAMDYDENGNKVLANGRDAFNVLSIGDEEMKIARQETMLNNEGKFKKNLLYIFERLEPEEWTEVREQMDSTNAFYPDMLENLYQDHPYGPFGDDFDYTPLSIDILNGGE